jgi:hypothetical protein
MHGLRQSHAWVARRYEYMERNIVYRTQLRILPTRVYE